MSRASEGYKRQNGGGAFCIWAGLLGPVLPGVHIWVVYPLKKIYIWAVLRCVAEPFFMHWAWIYFPPRPATKVGYIFLYYYFKYILFS